ncbi:MAG: tripartite tricarboxylate transporter substrate binding protein, partial [Burkholderiales bacterium]
LYIVSAAFAGQSMAQPWRPDKHVELIVPAEAGGSLDTTGRTIHRIMEELKLLPGSSAVVNRAGGAHAVAYAYLNQRSGDGHFLSITSANLLGGHIAGRLPMSYSDVSPIATLLSENIAFAVRIDSPINSGKDLMEALKKNPGQYSIALGSAVGGTHHVAAGLPLQSAGVDIKQVKMVGYNASGGAVAALLGGHVDVVVASTVNVSQQVEAGKLKTIAVTAPKRMTGALAKTPTWPEQGLKGVLENWRGVIGPRGLSAQQIAYWEGVMQKIVESEEFKAYAAKNQWDVTFRGAKEARAFMEQDYNQLKSVMTFLGLAKQP